MRRLVTLLAIALLTPALATAGPHLRWNACVHDPRATTDRAFACDTNDGYEYLAGSIWVPDSIPNVVGVTTIINLAWASPSFPSWWHFRNFGACRQFSASTLLTPPTDWTTCVDRYLGRAGGGIAGYTVGNPTPNRARLILNMSLSMTSFGVGPRSGETFLFGLRIDHLKTIGADACGGCQIPACIGIEYVDLNTPNGGRSRWTGYTSLDSKWFVTWQGGGGVQGDCPGAVPTRNATWGSIKSLYR